MEEFQESDVIWADHMRDDLHRPFSSSSNHKNTRLHRKEGSVPIRIPEGRPSWKVDLVRREWDREDEREEKEEMVPPHVMLARRVAGQMSFSVCTGNGRTLKGRDLSQVRNSVLRMTGFLEGWRRTHTNSNAIVAYQMYIYSFLLRLPISSSIFCKLRGKKKLQTLIWNWQF